MEKRFFIYYNYHAGRQDTSSRLAVIAENKEEAKKALNANGIPLLDKDDALSPPYHLAHHYHGYYCDDDGIAIPSSGIFSLPCNM